MLKKLLYLTMIFLLFFSFSLNAQKDVPKKVIKLVEKANAALTGGDIEKATKNLNKAMETYKDYAPIYGTFGKISVSQNNFPEAKTNFVKALALDPEYKEATKYYGQILAQEGQQVIQTDAKKALEIFQTVLALKNIKEVLPKGYVQLMYTCARLEQRYNNFEKSNKYFEDFLKLPNVESDFAAFYSPTFFSMGINYAQLKDIKNSNKNIEKYLELNQTMTDQNKPLIARANYMIGSNNFELLEEECEKIQNDKSIKEIAKKNIKMAEMATSMESKIVPYLNKAIELDPDFEDNYKFLGNFCRQLKLDEAIAKFDILINQFPGSDNITSYKSISETLKKKKETQDKKKK